ncbi:MAG: VWA domain-containing protein [Hyphomicrobiales bacterium]
MLKGRFVRATTLLAAFVTIVALLSNFYPAFADEPAPAVLILDSSGSMTARLPDGRIKLDAARDVITTTLESWPKGGEVAVVAYGHRRRSDCADIETVVPLGPLEPKSIARTLKKLQGRGKTPLSQSLIQAAQQLPKGGTIVLVSDGIETCDRDPCEVARALKEAQASLIIHIVGFGLQHSELDQLKCIADNAGGKVFDAQDAKELTTALTTVSNEVAKPPPPPPEEPTPPKQADSPPPPPPAPKAEPPRVVRTELVAIAGALGEITDTPVHWQVRDDKGGEVYDGESRALVLDLMPGSYAVSTLAANARNDSRIEVKEGQGQTFKIDLKAGRLDLSLASNKGATPYTDLETSGIAWTIEAKEGQDRVSVPSIAHPVLLLAPAAYRVTAALKGLEASADVTIVAGTASALMLDFRLGTVVLEAMLEGQTEPLSDASMVRWRIGSGETARVIDGEARPRVTLPEGNYPIELSIAGFAIAANAEIRGGDDKVISVPVKGGTLTLSAQLGPQSPPLDDWRDTTWTVAPVDALAGGSPLDFQTAAPSMTLPIGRWHITLKSGAAIAEKDIAVSPGSDTVLVINLGAGRAIMGARREDGAQPANIVFAAVAVDQSGNPTGDPAFEAGSNEEIATILPAGRWKLVADDSDGNHGEAIIDLAAGEEKRVEILLK